VNGLNSAMICLASSLTNHIAGCFGQDLTSFVHISFL